MTEDLNYWYGPAFEGGASGSNIPVQAIPLSKKNDKWKKQTMDAFESIGLKQIRENLRFADIFRMIDGKMSYYELSEVMPQYRELEETLGDLAMDTWIKHYDIIGMIINSLAGELASAGDKFTVSTVDEVSTNEYIRTKTKMLEDYVSQNFEKELKLKLLEKGINPETGMEDFQSEEEYQAYMQQIQQMKAEMTPEQIERYMKSDWKTVAAKWASIKIEEDTINHGMDMMDIFSFTQYLASGVCLRTPTVAHDYYFPENWHMLNSFFSQDLENNFIQNGDYVGRIHRFSRNQIITRYGHLLTPKEQKEILSDGLGFSYNNDHHSYKSSYESHFHRLQTVDFYSQPEYELALKIQNSIGMPMGERVIMGRDGELEKVPVLLPEINDVTGNLNGDISFDKIYGAMRNGINLRSDLMQVTEVYWKSYKRIGHLKYEDSEGVTSTEIVTEEILPEFLSENNISEVRSLPLSELEDQEKNTIIWVYQPEVWKGIKIKGAKKDYYLDVKPLEYQIKGTGNDFDVLLPVVGIAEPAFAAKIEPWQVMLNLVMNQITSLLEKEIGMFFLFDVAFLPAGMKEWGDTEEALIHAMDIAKDIGVLPIDSSKQNLGGSGAVFNQFAAQNLTFSQQLSDRMQLAEFIKNKALEQVGITPQRMGAPTKYENQEGIKVSQDATYAQTEQYFARFSEFKRRYLETHLAVAQYCQKNGKDLQVFFTQNDATQAFIKLSDDDFNLRKFSIVVTSNSKRKKQLEQYKEWLLRTNTIGTDELSMAEIMFSDVSTDALEAAKNARLSRQQEQQAQIQSQQQAQQQQQEFMKELENEKWQKQEYSKDKDRQKDIRVATINALGRAADNNSSPDGLDTILKQSDFSLRQEQVNANINTKNVELDLKREKIEEDRQRRLDEMKLKMEELATRREISKDNVRIATVNKN